jgi:hypothetical protein
MLDYHPESGRHQNRPSLWFSQPVAILEMTVPVYISIVMNPAYPSGTPNEWRIEGHAAPRTESGNPRDINAILIRTNKKVYIRHSSKKNLGTKGIESPFLSQIY